MSLNKNVTMLFCGFLFLAMVISACEAQSYTNPRDCPPDETYTPCGPSCQTECATLRQPCLIRHIRCPDGCYCNPGYARDATGTCIPISQCPKKRRY